MDSLASRPTLNQNNPPALDLYYKGLMNTGYKEDEKALRKIISLNVYLTNPETEIRLIIYYKNMKTQNLVLKNNCLPPTPHSKKSMSFTGLYAPSVSVSTAPLSILA